MSLVLANLLYLYTVKFITEFIFDLLSFVLTYYLEILLIVLHY